LSHPTCAVHGCKRTAKNGKTVWCDPHYRRWLKTGDPGPVEIRVKGAPGSADRACSIDGCGRTIRGGAKGWCASHYGRWRTYGDPLAEPPIRETNLPLEEKRRRKNEFSRQYHVGHRDELNEARRKRRTANWDAERATLYAWRAANPDRYLELCAAARDRRRTRLAGTVVEVIERAKLIAEHGMVCHICTEAIESLSMLELDHAIPVALDGPTTYENIRPSHRTCNRRKGARLLSELLAS
jgi:5-methylcytosine-specific restriction endonuclease McrA